MSRVFRLVLGALLVLVLTPGTGWAQATAQINGTVADTSGGVLPGVTVVAIQTETGFRREAVSDETGAYALLNLPIGPYRLEATLPGFRTYSQTGIVLQVNANPVIPVTMQLGSLEETVSVEASAPLVETRNPAIGGVIENEAVEALPLEGRNPVMLVMMAGAAADTGVPTSRSMTTSRGISITGGQPFGVAYLLDGANHNNVLDGLNLPLPFPDALQEFRVETSSQNAQNGRQGSGTVSLVTKAGTNLLHGDLFEFHRHHRFNSTSPFAAVDPATGKRRSDGLVRNQFGGTLGGPIATDRIFFFGAYQGTRATQTPADIVTFIPTPAMLAGDFTQIASAACRAQGNLNLPAPFVGNRISPAQLSPAALNIARRLPTTNDPCGRIAYSRKTLPREGQSIGRIDWQISQSHSLFGRYMLTTTFWDPALVNSDTILSASGAGAGGRDSDSQSLAIGDTMVLTNTIVNNIRFAANRTNVHRTHADMFGPQDVGVNIYTPIPNYMLLSVTGAFSINTGTETDSFYRPNTYAISDDLTMVRGNHQWGVGVSVGLSDWKTRSNVRSPGVFSFNGSATGLPLADFLLGNVFEFRQSTPFTLDIKQKYFALYGQDTWRMSPNVTMNYGVRWEPWFPQQHQQSQIYNFDIDRFRAGVRSTVFPQAPPGLAYPGDEGFPSKAGMYTEWLNIQPRVGVSWDPTGTGRTSVRAGYGMNSNFIAGEFYFDAAQAPPFGLEQRLINLPARGLDDPWLAAGRVNPYPITPGRIPEFPPYALLLAVPYDLETTRVHSWNAGVQQQIGENMGVSASYLGNYLTNVWGDVTGNPGVLPAGLASPTSPCTLRDPSAPGGTRTFPNCAAAQVDVRRELTQANPAVGQYIGYLDWVTDYGWQRYHGMLLSLQRRSTNGVSTNLNYTMSNCRGLISQGGGPLNVGTGYMLPVSLINPPANPEELFDADEGPCSNSPRHIFNVTASVETPQFANTALRVIASEWRLSGIYRAQSGRALNITTGADRALTGMQDQRPNQVLDDPYGDKSLNNWFNPAAFAQPAQGTHGNARRNGFEAPGTQVVDLSLVRSFRFFDTHRIEARVEAFNAFNWTRLGLGTNIGDPIINLSSATFGRILSSGDPRIMQFALKYQF
jgi:hypothetical protein